MLNFFLLALVLVRECLLQLFLRLFLLLVEALALLADRVPHVLLDLPLPLSNFLLALSLRFFFRIFQLVVVTGSVGPQTLAVAIQPHFGLFLNALSGFLNLFLLLDAEFLELATMLGFQADFFIFNLVAQQILRKKLDLLVDIS